MVKPAHDVQRVNPAGAPHATPISDVRQHTRDHGTHAGS